MAANLLCRHAELLGATFDQSSGSVVVTVQGDGVQFYSLEQRQLGSLTLGRRSGWEFQAASAQHSEQVPAAEQQQHRLSVIASVIHDRNAKSYSLCLSDPGASTRPISDAPSRLTLPGPAQSCHILQQRQQPTAAVGNAAAAPRCQAATVVLSDGRVAITELSPDSAGALNVISSGQQTAPRTVLSTSSRDTLLVATQQAAGSPVTLRVLRLAPSGDGSGAGLTQVKSVTLSCPGGASAAFHAVPTGLTMSAAFALLQWSNGHATSVHGIQGGAAAASTLRPCTFPLADAVHANGASTSASTPAAAPPSVTASSRKRKNAGATGGDGASGGAGARRRVLCAAVDDRQFVVLDLESAAAQSQICFSLHDAQFGCPLSSGSLEIDAPLLSLDAAHCAVVAAGPEATVVRLGGAVHVMHVRTQPVSLLSMVARLSVSATSAVTTAGVGGGTGPQAKPGLSGIGGAGVAKALVALPAPMELDQALLTRQAAGAAATTAVVADDDAQDVVLQPVPAAAVTRPEDICNSLVEQLTAAAAATALSSSAPSPPPPQALLDSAVSYIAGRRQHGMAVPPQLLALTARGLSAAKQWTQLGTLLQHVPQAGLSGCSEVLVAVAAAQQYNLLSRLATCLDEVDPEALVSTLQLLLSPTTRNNLAARQQHYLSLRKVAAALVEEMEKAVAGGTALRRNRGRHRPSGAPDAAAGVGALAMAQVAAAAIDGFSYREVLLHPLLAVPTDAPAVQVALRRLSAPAADALLSYLAKWVAKYTGGAVGDISSEVAVPEELLFPYYVQVLEWTRMTMDAHLTRLLMARATPLPALESLEAALNGAMEGSKRLLMLRGALEHVHAAAPLPAAHIAVATQYTAEVLDLRVR